MKAIAAAVLVHLWFVPALTAGGSHSANLKEIEESIDRNLAKIKTLRCKVEVLSFTPGGSTKESFHLLYKYPHLIRTESIGNKENVFINRKDSAYFKNGMPRKPSGMMISIIKPDRKGRLFNPIPFLTPDLQSEVEPCGENLCVTCSGRTPKEISNSVRSDSVSTFTLKMEYSRKKKVIESYRIIAGPAISTATLKYQKVAGVMIPEQIVLQIQTVTMKTTFQDCVLNKPVSEEEFK